MDDKKLSEVSTVVSRYRRTEFVHLFNESGACLKKCNPRAGLRLATPQPVMMTLPRALAMLLLTATANASLTVSNTLGSNMVLQRGKPAPIWGWATPAGKGYVYVQNLLFEDGYGTHP